MAATYDILGAVGTIELVGGGQTRDVVQVTARAKPSGVNFTLVIAKVDYTAQRLPLIFGPVSEAVNNAMEVDGVADLNIYQDVNQAGQFVNKLDVLVESSSGNSDTTIHPRYGSLFDNGFAQAVASAQANMDAIESL